MRNIFKQAYMSYIDNEYNSRSSVPVNILHNGIADLLESIMDPTDSRDFIIRASSRGGEYKFKSEIHSKNIDITLVDTTITPNKPILAISVKMPFSSVNKNFKNYFEMNTGDTTLVRESGVPFFLFMLLDANGVKNNSGRYVSDPISATSIRPYSKIISSSQYKQYRPNQTFIVKADFEDMTFKNSHFNNTFAAARADRYAHLSEISAASMDNVWVYKSDESWDNDFDACLEEFKQMIKLEIELYKIRKRH